MKRPVPWLILLIGGMMLLGLFSRFFGRADWDLSSVEPPWGDRPSIYAHILAHASAGEEGLAEGGDTLPDDAEVFEEGKMRWVSGGLDGAFGHHGAGGDEQDAAQEVFTLLKSVLEDPTQQRIATLYIRLEERAALDLIDPLLERIVRDPSLDADRLHDLALWLVTKAADREPVKVGLAILGVFQGYDDRDTILALARHEEFTLYAAVAISNTEENPDRILWQMAKHVDGWGRIQTLERLEGTTDPEIKSWLLREGYRNSVMYEYLAYLCATTGDLRSALMAGEVDEALLLGAGDILSALITGQGGPAEGMLDYEDGAAATREYLRHLEGRADDLEQFLVFKTIEGFLADKDRDWEEASKRGWTAEARSSMLARIEPLLRAEIWRNKVEEALQNDSKEFAAAAETAKHLGMDTWGEYYARTKAGEGHWYHLMQTRDRSRAERVVALFQDQVSLTEIAAGPGQELGLGPGFRQHSDLDFVLQELGRFPGLGWPLIEAGLRSPVVRNRNMALRALSGWEQDDWPEGAKEYVESCRLVEPDEKVRERMDELLAGLEP